MLLNALCFVALGQTDTRVLDEVSIFNIKNTCTITRTVGDDGGVVWSEKSEESKGVYWVHEFVYGAQGGFISQKDSTVSGSREDLFTVGIEGGKAVARMVKYNNESSDSSVAFKGDASELADSSRLWWVSAKPEVGAKVKSFTYVQMFGFSELTVDYVGDATIKVKGRSYDTHKIVRQLDGLRKETWWVDDKGLPVKRAFWTNDENDPHRVDEIR